MAERKACAEVADLLAEVATGAATGPRNGPGQAGPAGRERSGVDQLTVSSEHGQHMMTGVGVHPDDE